jgi:hypothetical protein
MRNAVLSLVALWAGPASAFCGTYVGGAGSELTNQTSRIAIARQGNQTTLTLANDFEGNAVDFAMVIPVPEILGPDDVRVVDSDLLDVLDGYSGPRLVRYECEDFYGDHEDAATQSDGGGSGGDSPPADTVHVEAKYVVGAYEIVILSATESGGLLTWLEDNGYSVGDQAIDLLGEYIDSGAYFFAAKVYLDELPEGEAFLDPLQFSYTAGAFSLPIRLGTLNSPGEQDLVLYMLTDSTDGRVGISNYPEATIEDECMVDLSEYVDFGHFYSETIADAFDEEEASWLLEYAWSTGSCDPCSGDPPTQEQAEELGFEGDVWSSFITRIRMRYTPDGASQDLMLYASGLNTSDQIRFIEYDEQMEDMFPVCGIGMVTDPGTCDDGSTGTGDEDPPEDDDPTTGINDDSLPSRDLELGAVEGGSGFGLGCGAPVAPSGLLALIGLLTSARRRRSVDLWAPPIPPRMH